jgi:hypothetical protein
MADLTVAEFKARFPEFASASEPTIEYLIEDTLDAFDQDRWGNSYKRGHSLYVAHLYTLRTKQLAGNSGTGSMDSASQKAVDGVSASMAVLLPTSQLQSFFNGTSYGREYLMLQRTVGIGGVANTIGCDSIHTEPWDNGGNVY